MAISIIPKLNEARGDKFNNKLTDGIKSHIINIICLYNFSYIFLFCQYFLKDIWNKLIIIIKELIIKNSIYQTKKVKLQLK